MKIKDVFAKRNESISWEEYHPHEVAEMLECALLHIVVLEVQAMAAESAGGDERMYDVLLKQWAEEQGFQTWSQDHKAVLHNLSTWLNQHKMKVGINDITKYEMEEGKNL